MGNLRPLGAWSDFVINDLPSIVLLAEIAHQQHKLLIAKERFLSIISSIEIQCDLDYLIKNIVLQNSRPSLGWRNRYTEKDLALIDLKFIDASFYHLFGHHLEQLREPIDKISKEVKRPPILT